MATHSSIVAWRIHGQRSLEGCSSWGRKESDKTERLTHVRARAHTHTHTHTHTQTWTHIELSVGAALSTPIAAQRPLAWHLLQGWLSLGHRLSSDSNQELN